VFAISTDKQMRSEFSAADRRCGNLGGWHVSLPQRKDGDSAASRIRRNLQAIVDTGRDDGPLKDLRFRCMSCGSRLTDHVTMAKHGGLPWRLRLGRKGL